LESIVTQFNDRNVRENTEVVISDNASTDGTEPMVKEFQNKFSNILYCKNSENIGVDRNILNAAEKAKGEFIWFLGDDDALFPWAIGYMLEKLKQHKFKYCLVNCLGYDNSLVNPAVRLPNFAMEADQYYENLNERIKNMDKNNLVGDFCGLSIQICDRQLWQAWPDKQKYVGSNAVHLHVLLSAMKDQSFAVIAKPLVKVRAANIRWDTFPGLETITKRAQSTSRLLLWILEMYKIPHSKLALKIEEKKNIFKIWSVNTLKKFLFKSQGSRDLIKKLMGKL
jgi:abequosyltransferase